jgi:predicted nucleic acid-binding protein
VLVSILLKVEVMSALARRTREGGLSTTARETLERILLAEYSRCIRWDLREEIPDIAAALVFRRSLRTLDSLQLASALHVAQFLGVEDRFFFIASDHRLLAAAVQEGLPVWNPESGPAPVSLTG